MEQYPKNIFRHYFSEVLQDPDLQSGFIGEIVKNLSVEKIFDRVLDNEELENVPIDKTLPLPSIYECLENPSLDKPLKIIPPEEIKILCRKIVFHIIVMDSFAHITEDSCM